MKLKIKRKNSLQWLFEPLESDSEFTQRKLFSFESAYLGDRLYLAVSDGEEPWNGMLICTAREHHDSLQKQFPELVSHEVLGKWLYLSQNHPVFERIATELVELAKKRDPRLGVDPKPRKRRKLKS